MRIQRECLAGSWLCRKPGSPWFEGEGGFRGNLREDRGGRFFGDQVFGNEQAMAFQPCVQGLRHEFGAFGEKPTEFFPAFPGLQFPQAG